MLGHPVNPKKERAPSHPSWVGIKAQTEEEQTFTYLLTSLLTYVLTHLHSTYRHTYILTYLLTYSRTYVLTYLLTYLLTVLLTYLLSVFRKLEQSPPPTTLFPIGAMRSAP